MSVFRAFIAIDLSAAVSQNLEQALAEFKTRLPGQSIRWVAAPNIHLTIKFLGDVAFNSQGLLTQTLQAEAARHAAFEISVGGSGVFPNPRRPQVLWVGVQAPAGLGQLRSGVERELARLGFAPEERPFSPHLTLGRVSRDARPEEIRRISQAFSQYSVGLLGGMRVQAIHLYRSDLQPGGPLYTRLFSANLNAICKTD